MGEPNKVKLLRFDWAYHFVTVPLALIVFVWSIFYLVQAFRGDGQITPALLLFLTSLCLVFAASLIRVYATKTQDRIIRMEEQFRHHRLTGRPLNPSLTIAQIIALRNSGDDEFPALSERAAAENLNAAQIKSAIKNWRTDMMRI